MEERVFGDVGGRGLEVVRRDARYYVRYDAGAHQVAWREDELTETEFERLRMGQENEHAVMIALQRRIAASGGDPYTQNWTRV